MGTAAQGSVFLIDDDPYILELHAALLRSIRLNVHCFASSTAFLDSNVSLDRGCILSDVRMPVMGGLQLQAELVSRGIDTPIIFITGHADVPLAIQAMKAGAADFIEKPFNIDQLMVVVSRAMETSRLRRENADLRRRDVSSTEMLGASSAFKTLKSHLEKVTKSNGRVMLTGPAGSGKEMAARFIHQHSNRAGAAFVSVSSATIEPERMEEVLFGRETSERGVEKGLLEQAHGGVVYFDEVADMPLGTQSKILRVLTEQQFTRAGGTDKVRVDLRVISSTTALRAERTRSISRSTWSAVTK